MKLVLEIVTVVFTFAIMGGCGLACWFTYDSMVADLNRSLPPGNKIPIIFSQRDSRAAFYNLVEEHRKQFPESKLVRRFFVFLVLQVVTLGLFALELGLFKTFHPLP
jgi:hypothetical protein